MAVNVDCTPELALADGTCWHIHAGDPEAARVVVALAAAMSLSPALPPRLQDGAGSPARPPALAPAAEGPGGATRDEITSPRELLATVVRGKAPPARLAGTGPVVCALSPLLNDEMLTIGMTHLALLIAREAQARGGLLLHGALAALDPLPGLLSFAPSGRENGVEGGARGILLAGPGTVGKTTASNRLPPPWRSLSDDAALVVRDDQGRYWAHPWPTWSRFYTAGGTPGPGGRWDVQRAVPLRAILFLSQSPDDRVEPLDPGPTMAMLLEAAQHVSGSMARLLESEETQALHRQQLAAAEMLAHAVPAYTLHLSLTGTFWHEIEAVLEHLPPLTPDLATSSPHNWHSPARGGVRRRPARVSRFTADESHLLVVYTGPSMNPTLAEPDLLEVVPIAVNGKPPRRGDVIYFQPPDGGREVVHRVAAVTPEGIRTRGDNNPRPDPHVLQPHHILGRVVAARRGRRRRPIAGGGKGALCAAACRPWRLASQGLGRLLHGAYRGLARSGRFGRWLPAGLRPRVYVFRTRHQAFLKVLMAGRVVGHYDPRLARWHIRRPFRLFVDAAALPVPERPPDRIHRPNARV